MPAAVGNDPTEAYELSPEVKSVDVVVSMVTLDPFESATWHVTPVADLPLYPNARVGPIARVCRRLTQRNRRQLIESVNGVLRLAEPQDNTHDRADKRDRHQRYACEEQTFWFSIS